MGRVMWPNRVWDLENFDEKGENGFYQNGRQAGRRRQTCVTRRAKDTEQQLGPRKEKSPHGASSLTSRRCCFERHEGRKKSFILLYHARGKCGYARTPPVWGSQCPGAPGAPVALEPRTSNLKLGARDS